MTFVTHLLLSAVIRTGIIAIVVASSGIAATLLTGKELLIKLLNFF